MPEAKIISTENQMGLQRYSRTSFFLGGRDGYTQPPAQNPDMFLTMENVLPPTRGAIEPRWGTSAFGDGTATIAAHHMYSGRNSSGAYRIICSAGDGSGVNSVNNRVIATNEVGELSTNVYTPTAGAISPTVEVSRNWAYFMDGIQNRKWSINSAVASSSVASAVSNSWGFPPPVNPGHVMDGGPVGAPGSGAVTLDTGRIYYSIWVNENTGHASDLFGPSETTGPLAAQDILVSGWPFTPPVDTGFSSGTQITHLYLIATSDGGPENKLYFVQKWAVGAVPGTYIDTMLEETLLLQNVYLEVAQDGVTEIGVSDNLPPPVPDMLPNTNVMLPPVLHRGRMFIAHKGVLYFSKSAGELITSTQTPNVGRFEECFPPSYQLDVSPKGSELIRGLLSDGQQLYIGTDRRIITLIGSGPADFAEPQTLHYEVGVSFPETWKIVYVNNQPVGSMWMTPDYRVILSDFNSYVDVGVQVQDILNRINVANAWKSWSMYYGKGAYEFFILAIPIDSQTSPGQFLIYDLKNKRWVNWDVAYSPNSQGYTAGLYYLSPTTGAVTAALSSAIDASLDKFDPTITADMGHNPVSKLRTTWLDLGDAASRKMLNEIVFLADSGYVTSVNVYGASTPSQFNAPRTIISNATPKAAPLSTVTDRYVYTATKAIYDRWISLEFTLVVDGNPPLYGFPIISGFEIEFIYLDKF